MIIGRFVYDGGTTEAVAAGAAIPMPEVTTNSRLIAYDGAGGILLKAPGTYRFSANFTAVSGGTGEDFAVQMYEGGEAVAGAAGSQTLAASGDYGSVAIEAVSTVRQAPDGWATVQFRSVGASAIDVATAVVEKVG